MNKWHFQTLCTSYCLKQAEITLHILLAEVHNREEPLGPSQGLNLIGMSKLIIIVITFALTLFCIWLMQSWILVHLLLVAALLININDLIYIASGHFHQNKT